MLLRTLVNLVNFGILAVVVVVLLRYPADAGSAFYLVLGWMIGSLILIYGPWGSRRVGGGPAPAPGAPTRDVPLPGAPAPPPRTALPFCIYCAAPLPVGATKCPACGHATVHV